VRAPSAAIDQARLLPLVLPLMTGEPNAAGCLQAMEFADAFRRLDGEIYQGVARFRAVTQRSA